MIKDCRDCKFCLKMCDWCRLHGTSSSVARTLRCGIEDPKHFTPKKIFFKSIFKFLLG